MEGYGYYSTIGYGLKRGEIGIFNLAVASGQGKKKKPLNLNL